MTYDFNDAESNSFDLIPAGTVCPLIMTIRPGSTGEGGWETASNSSDATYLSCEFAVTGGQYKGRKFWGNLVVSGGKKNSDGSSIAGNITRSTLRGILESSRKIKPDDASDNAQKARIVEGYGDFSGMEFVGKIGIEKGTGGYDDKNKLTAPVPVTSKAYYWENSSTSPSAAQISGSQSSAPKAGAPSWAA